MPSEFTQSVKAQADIVRIIGEYVRLKKAGAQNYQGLCPFHGEKSPSFSVHAVRQFYHCFGCGVSGDVFTFIQETEKVSFPEAVRIVAGKCGMPLPKREFSSEGEAAESRQRTQLLELHEGATEWFCGQLRTPEGARAREYLSSRGLNAELAAKFRIGYAPESFTGLRDRLAGGAPSELLRLSGLFGSKEGEDGTPGRLYDRFRKRVTFPILNEGGRVIAFTARALDSDEKAGPKYLNSPETPLYSKGSVLFNLDKARTAIRQSNFALLVEGQMDCISVFAAGIPNVLASSGTAFTEQQARLLRRYATRVVVNFDPDAAGANAAEKSIALLTEEGFEVRVVTLEAGLDPDRYIRDRGAKAYAEALRGAVRHSEYLIERARTLHPGRTPEAKVAAVNFLLPHIRRMPNAISRDEFAADAAQKLGIDSALVREQLRSAAVAKRREAAAGTAAGALSECERVLLRALATPLEGKIFHLAAAAFRDHPGHFQELTSSELIELLCRRECADALEAAHSHPGHGALAQLLMGECAPVEAEQLEAALEVLQRRFYERAQRQLRAKIAEAERRADLASLAGLTAEKLNIDRLLRESV